LTFPARFLLPLALLVQSLLLFPRLDLLPLWDDERYTVQTAGRSLAGILEAVQVDVHPPLYYFLVRAWLDLPLPGDVLIRARALSVLITLAATALFYHLWLRPLETRRQALFLALWVASPCLVLYARMARSYSLQVLVAVAAIRYASDWLHDPRSRRVEIAYAASAALLLYVHYLPGLAVIAGVAALALWRRQWRALRPLAWVALAYLPWLATLAHTAGLVAAARPYWLGANWAVENLLKLSYAFVAFQFGETVPMWSVVAGTALLPAIGAALWRAWRSSPRPPVLFLLLAGAGYFVAASWVSFAFVGARLVFLLPFYYLFLLRGLDTGTRTGRLTYAALVILLVGGLTSYYRRQDFLNKVYLVDFEAVASRIHEDTRDEASHVLLDYFASSAGYYLHGPNTRYLKVLDGDVARREALNRIHADRPALVWYVHYTRQVAAQPDIVTRLTKDYHLTRNGFIPYSALDRLAFRVLGVHDAPTHLLEALEFRRRSASP